MTDDTPAGHHDGALGAVYGATTPEQIAALYDGWAARYEADMAAAGYRHPTICLALLTRHLPRGEGPVLDAGAGTGLIGQWLKIVGYPVAEALDISEGMLAVAAAKGCYSAVHRAALGSALPLADHRFAGIIAAGVFTSGHVGAEGLDELVRVCRPGAIIVLTVKTTLWTAGFAHRLAALPLRILEETAPYVSMPGEAGTVPSLALALARL